MSLYLSIGVLQPHFVAKADKVEVIWYIMLLQLGSQHLSSLAAACVRGYQIRKIVSKGKAG